MGKNGARKCAQREEEEEYLWINDTEQIARNKPIPLKERKRQKSAGSASPSLRGQPSLANLSQFVSAPARSTRNPPGNVILHCIIMLRRKREKREREREGWRRRNDDRYLDSVDCSLAFIGVCVNRGRKMRNVFDFSWFRTWRGVAREWKTIRGVRKGFLDVEARVLTWNYYRTLKELLRMEDARRDSKSFIFESIFEFIVTASVHQPSPKIIISLCTFPLLWKSRNLYQSF